MLIGICQLDTAATKATGGYDSDFGAVNVSLNPRGRRVSARVNKPEIRLLGQVEDQSMAALQMFGAGNSPEAKLAITFSFKELEEHRLVDPETRVPLLNVNDQLVAIYSREGKLILGIRPPGLFCVEVRPASIGLSSQAGIVVCRYNDRALSESPG